MVLLILLLFLIFVSYATSRDAAFFFSFHFAAFETAFPKSEFPQELKKSYFYFLESLIYFFSKTVLIEFNINRLKKSYEVFSMKKDKKPIYRKAYGMRFHKEWCYLFESHNSV